MKNTKYRNRRLESLHKTAEALRKVNALDKATMHDIDAFCLTKVEALSAPARAARSRSAPRLRDPLRCLKYAARRGSVPSGKGS